MDGVSGPLASLHKAGESVSSAAAHRGQGERGSLVGPVAYGDDGRLGCGRGWASLAAGERLRRQVALQSAPRKARFLALGRIEEANVLV